MRNPVFLSLVVVAVSYVALAAQSHYASEDGRQATQEERGRISGLVLDSATEKPSQQARVNLWTFDRKIMLKDGRQNASQLCELVSKKTDSNPGLVCDPSIENERLELGNREATIWELMEVIYLARGWKLIEQGDRTLLLCPGE